MIYYPFSDEQFDTVYKEAQNQWMHTHELYIKNNQYVDLVLVPDMLIKVYQIYFNLKTEDDAEARLMNTQGCLLPQDISPESSLFLK